MFPNALPLDACALVNRQHPLAEGLLDWWMVLPHLRGGTRLTNLVRPQVPLALEGMQAALNETTGWHTTRRRGGFGELRLSGVDERLTAADRPEWFFSTGTQDRPFTVSCALWINTVGAINSSFVGKVSLNIGAEWQIYHYQSGDIYFQIYDTTTDSSMWCGAPYTAADYLNQWLTLTATFTGEPDTAGMALYRNGVRADIPALTGYTPEFGIYVRMRSQGVGLACGWAQNAALQQHWLSGRLDDVRLYPRALSAAEVADLYENQGAGYPGLLNRLPWDQLSALPKGRRMTKSPTRVWRRVG